MKTAISIPDDLNDSIEAFRKTAKITRSEFFQRAARVYLRRVSGKVVTANLDRVHSVAEHPADHAFRRASIDHLKKILEDEDDAW